MGALLVLGGLALLVAPGAGAAKLQTRAKTVTLKGGLKVTRAAAACPKGSVVISGGFRTSRPKLDTGPAAVVSESRRVSKRRWQVSAQGAVEGSRRGKLTVYAYCLEGAEAPLKRTKVKRYEFPPDQFGRRTAIAKCPKGTRVVSGGFFVPRGLRKARAFVDESAPAGARAWRVSALIAVDENPSGRRRITAYANCGSGGGTALSRKVGVVPRTEGARARATARCRGGTATVGGGFSAPARLPSETTELSVPLVYESRMLGGRRWRTSAIQASSEEGRSPLRSHAVCG